MSHADIDKLIVDAMSGKYDDTPPDNPCGDPDCFCSSDPFDQMTFGKGKLDFNGYFEFPCIPCAEEYVSKHPECVYASTGGVAVLSAVCAKTASTK